jgi:hypothetical protein
MSPEMELLDQLLCEDESLYLALMIFGWPENSGALERARHAILMQARDGLIEVIRKSDTFEEVLKDWEIRQALADEANWLEQGEEAAYFLSLTDKGVQYIG